MRRRIYPTNYVADDDAKLDLYGAGAG